MAVRTDQQIQAALSNVYIGVHDKVNWQNELKPILDDFNDSKINWDQRGAANGVASLNANSRLPKNQSPIRRMILEVAVPDDGLFNTLQVQILENDFGYAVNNQSNPIVNGIVEIGFNGQGLNFDNIKFAHLQITGGEFGNFQASITCSGSAISMRFRGSNMMPILTSFWSGRICLSE